MEGAKRIIQETKVLPQRVKCRQADLGSELKDMGGGISLDERWSI